MNLHANAALSLKGRRELCLAVVEQERTLAAAAEAAGVSVRCARKWVGRYRAEGEAGLRDRSSAPPSTTFGYSPSLPDDTGIVEPKRALPNRAADQCCPLGNEEQHATADDRIEVPFELD